MSVKIPGTPINLGGDEYIVAPLNFRQIKELKAELAALKGTITIADDSEAFDTFCKIVQASLSRNYPDMTIDKVQDILDIGNAPKAVMAIMGMSGLEQTTNTSHAPGGAESPLDLSGTLSTSTSSPAAPEQVGSQ